MASRRKWEAGIGSRFWERRFAAAAEGSPPRLLPAAAKLGGFQFAYTRSNSSALGTLPRRRRQVSGMFAEIS